MSVARYDFYRDLLETHTEIGYLLVIVLALASFDAVVAATLWRWPRDDVYLVPGVDRCGSAAVIWGSPAVGDAAIAGPAAAAEPRQAPRIDLAPGAAPMPAGPRP